ncbi:J domain-containing protein, partial [Synechococcus sp. MU1644]|nr:J domain-containing protein [Synechococcus sp. MU1644]
MSKDLYKILGVSRTASADEIRRAYKRKAKESHPDLHPGDVKKADTFKSASSAYEILGDQQKRSQYDRGEIDGDGNPRGFGGQQGYGGAGQTSGGFQGDPFEEILSGMFGGGRRRPGPRKGNDVRYRVEIAFEDTVTGARREMTVADGRALNVSLPPGIETGQTLRLKSQGKPSSAGGPPG